MLLLIAVSNKLEFSSGTAKEANFLSENQQIFVICNFKIALKSLRLIRKVISSCLLRKEYLWQTMFNLFINTMEYVFVDCNYGFFPWQLG